MIDAKTINFDDRKHLSKIKDEMVQISVGELYMLLNFYYMGGGEPDSLNDRLANVMNGGSDDYL